MEFIIDWQKKPYKNENGSLLLRFELPFPDSLLNRSYSDSTKFCVHDRSAILLPLRTLIPFSSLLVPRFSVKNCGPF
jgi:hypothetical protein